MSSARVLLIGNATSDEFLPSLQRRYVVKRAYSGKQALEQASDEVIDVIILDAVSMRTSGERICRSLQKTFSNCSIIHIHPGPKKMAQSSADVTVFLPLTARKLLSVIDRLIQSDSSHSIYCGPFQLNPTTLILTTHGREIQLNPKQAELITIFLCHPNEVIERKTIMEKVWNTDYLGDTRTLDVHIRWVRTALENGKDSPRYLKTVRGVGYMLDIPKDNNN